MDLLLTGQARTVPEPMDVDQFMAFLETRPNGEHWELIEGVAVMMAPASIAHQLIASNFCSLLNTALRANGIPLFACSNIGLRNPGLRTFQPEPDVVVLPGVAGYELYAEEFYLAGEILSPSNTKREIDTKLRRYFEGRKSLYAVVIDPRKILVRIYAKSRGWDPGTLNRAHDPIEMPEFGLRCRVEDVYRGTPLAPRA